MYSQYKNRPSGERWRYLPHCRENLRPEYVQAGYRHSVLRQNRVTVALKTVSGGRGILYQLNISYQYYKLFEKYQITIL